MIRNMIWILLGLCLGCAMSHANVNATQTSAILYEVQFQNGKVSSDWSFGGLTPPKIEHGILKTVLTGNDPMIFVPNLNIKTKPGQYLEIKMRSNGTGPGELYFTNTNEGRYGGFSPEIKAEWHMIHDGKWHVYRIYPKWLSLDKIIKIRIDPGSWTGDTKEAPFVEIEYVKIGDYEFDKAAEIVPNWNTTNINKDWSIICDQGQTTFRSNRFKFNVDQAGTWFSFDMTAAINENVTEMKTGMFRFWGNQTQGMMEFPFKLHQGRFAYNLDLISIPEWSGEIYCVEMVVPVPDAKITMIAVGNKPKGPACMDIEYSGMENALNRTGQNVRYLTRMANNGGSPFTDLIVDVVFDQAGKDIVWSGMSVNDIPVSDRCLKRLDPMTKADVVLTFRSPKSGSFDGSLVLKKNNGEILVKSPIRLEITPSLSLPKSAYVPQPQPVKSQYEIGALYFPGWCGRARWDQILDSQPIRKPVLGWYDEANPEVVDWQIKWAAESGIQYFFVDWYWNRGRISLDHWIKAFQKARYRSHLKWAMMWANHNGSGSHSEEDMKAVTQYWVEHYFNTAEYYTIDGKPVVMIWSPEGMDNDIIAIEAAKGKTLKKGEGVKRLLDVSRKVAMDAGYKGIYFVTMKWPEISTSKEIIQTHKDSGFDATSLYHFMSSGGKAKNPLRFSFDLVVDANREYLEQREAAGILPWFPNISTGWDSRPWHGDRQVVIYDRTVEKFKTICRDMKNFADRTGKKRLLLAPLNEWGEGSYAEPNLEFGFGMYETIREVFGEKPAKGFPTFIGPTDVGLGPYDLPKLPPPVKRTAWDFNDGSDQKVHSLMAIDHYTVREGKLTFNTVGNDPAISFGVHNIHASEWSGLRIRMKVSGQIGQETAQLFWIPRAGSASEQCSLRIPVIADDKFHDYVFPLKSSKQWQGIISSFRFDPVNIKNVQVQIDEIALEK